MERRDFLGLGALATLSLTSLHAEDFREYKPIAWIESNMNDAAMALYGKETFSTIRESDEVKLVAPGRLIDDPTNIPIKINSSIKAKSLAIFQNANPASLVAVFTLHDESIINYELNIRMQMKGTLFAVVEGIDSKLYYARHFIDVFNFSCGAS